ncbi:MAG TPA: NAD-dependent epimerase [Terriglobia bacterium]|nr:NAD-dependent epimerase [Terriglobia bacterium]
MENTLVTGCAGFIGFHLSKRLLDEGRPLVGLDNLNPYYDVNVKKARLAQLQGRPGFRFLEMDLADRQGMTRLFEETSFPVVVNLAAQAGVRYSLTCPEAYIDSNLVGFGNVLEGCRRQGVKHLVYASSSSVYGGNTRMPFSTRDGVDHPLSLYAATKRANELMAHVYSHLFGLPTTGLRFFTVYGPWGRPDMALFLFTQAILEDRPIDVFNHGNMRRDFTYIDDIVEGVARVMEKIPQSNPDSDNSEPDRGCAPFRVYNIGNNCPVELITFIGTLERKLGKKARLNLLPMQPGDVPATCADVDDLARDTGFQPSTSVEEGIGRFVSWYRQYYGV